MDSTGVAALREEPSGAEEGAKNPVTAPGVRPWTEFARLMAEAYRCTPMFP